MKNKFTIGIFAHVDAGKTTLTENLLAKSGILKTVGKVDTGNTATDDLKVERDKGITVRSSLVEFETENNIFYLIDTPGHMEFVSEVERVLNVLDCAILVVSSVEGVEAQTHMIFNNLLANNIPTIIFVNKIDRLGNNLNKCVHEIEDVFKINTLTLNSFYETNCIDDANISLSCIDNTFSSSKDRNKIINAICKNMQSGKLFPLFYGSALYNKGIDNLYNFLNDMCLEIDNTAEQNTLSGYVFHIRYNGNVKNIYIKIMTGCIAKNQIILVDNQEVKIDKLFKPQGLNIIDADVIKSGEIAVLQNLDFKLNDIIGENTNIRTSAFLKPFYSVELICKNNDEQFLKAIKTLNLEDDALNIRFEKSTNSFLMDIIGDIQIDVMKQIFEDRFGLVVEFKNKKIIYKETINKECFGKCSYTSCSAVGLKIEPNKENSVIYDEAIEIHGKLLPRYSKQVRRLALSNLQNTPFGWELIRSKITLEYSRYDNVGSESMHFNACVPIAMMRALKTCGTILLEPYYSFEINVDEQYLLSIKNLLKKANAQINNFIFITNKVKIEGIVSVENSQIISQNIMSITKGMAKYYYSFYDYIKCDKQIENENRVFDTRNEALFIQNYIKGNIKLLDKEKKKKTSKKIPFAKRVYDKDNL